MPAAAVPIPDGDDHMQVAASSPGQTLSVIQTAGQPLEEGFISALTNLLELHILQSADVILAGVSSGQLERPTHLLRDLTGSPAPFLAGLSMLGFQPMHNHP